ncbi:hypothetical protein COO60DRAFT_1701528 [Scenedesmus sp. NREL 46B-D3]|nr:hypothetical protein COO60DRAFT_1701528 [Scenedesmus sp. NREL 46B-D3]
MTALAAAEGCHSTAALADRHFSMLAAALESIEGRSEALTSRLAAAEAEAAMYKARMEAAEHGLARLTAQLESGNTEQQAQKREVCRLSALLEASQLQAALSSEQLLADVGEERARCERLRAVRDDALLQRDDALLELANAYADIDAMQATLADSALYVRQLRQRVTELELRQQQQQHQAAKQQHGGQADWREHRDQGVFSIASIQASVQAAVAAAAQEPEAERKRRIRQLQLRWHPDKNPVLKEFATEVTKVINEAVAALEGQQ